MHRTADALANTDFKSNGNADTDGGTHSYTYFHAYTDSNTYCDTDGNAHLHTG